MGSYIFTYVIFNWKKNVFLGENTVKGGRGAKVKVLFQKIAHNTCYFCVGL